MSASVRMRLAGDDDRRFGRRVLLGGALIAVGGYAGWRWERPPAPIKGVNLARRAGPITSVAFGRDGRFAVTAGELVRVWDVDARKLVRSFRAPAYVRWLAVDDQRGIVVVSGSWTSTPATTSPSWISRPVARSEPSSEPASVSISTAFG